MSKRVESTSKSSPKGTVLGLAMFEKISAVEGVKLTPQMKQDLRTLERRQMTPEQRTRFIAEKYGRKPA